SRRRHTRFSRDWSSDVCSSDLKHLFITLCFLTWCGLQSGFGLHTAGGPEINYPASEEKIPVNVSGTVTDNTGEPLIGVNVLTKRPEERRVGEERRRGSAAAQSH